MIDPKICHGKPIIRGTRLPTDVPDIGLGSAEDETIASYAKSNQMASYGLSDLTD